MTDELKACPFCGGKAERIDIADGENAGGSVISCTHCYASGAVEFEFKENFISHWNRRTPDVTQIFLDSNAALTTEVLALRASLAEADKRTERLLNVLSWIDYHADNQDMSHRNFRYGTVSHVRAALSQTGKAGT